jgi:hypothetical protein
MPEVEDWLKTLGMSGYAQRFAESGIDVRTLPAISRARRKNASVQRRITSRHGGNDAAARVHRTYGRDTADFRIDEGRVVEEQRLGLGPGSRSTENG